MASFAALRGDATLKRLFPFIEITGLKANAGQDWDSSVRLLQRRLFAQGRNDQDTSPAISRRLPQSHLPNGREESEN